VLNLLSVGASYGVVTAAAAVMVAAFAIVRTSSFMTFK
jgi:hypothetical protein